MAPPRIRSHLLAAVAAAALLAAPIHAQNGPPHPDTFLPALGRGYLAAHCPDGATAESCDLDMVLSSEHVHVRLGIFDLWFPAQRLSEPRQALDLIQIGDALLSLQRAWIELAAGGREQAVEALADLALVQAWVNRWDASAFGKLASSRQRDLLAAQNASPEVRAASERLQERLMSREAMGIAPQHTTGIGLVICPTRRDLMEMIGFVGLTDPVFREANWHPGIDQYTAVWVGERVLLGLQYAPWTGFDDKFATGIPVSKFSALTGFKEYVVQHAAEALLFRNFNDSSLRLQEKSLAIHLVIQTLKRINTLDTDGGISTSGATTQPYERFVPGGASEGGVLPGIPAAPFDAIVSSRWREGHGVDHFLKPLRDGQKEGAKAAAKDKKSPLAKDKRPHFQLVSPEDKTMLVRAPFLGPLAYQKPYPPPEFINDFREFFRSYNACFLNWLRTQGSGDRASSEEDFRTLLHLLAEREPLVDPEAPPVEPFVKKGFYEALELAYGMPVSSDTPDESTLEWRFLGWLAGAR